MSTKLAVPPAVEVTRKVPRAQQNQPTRKLPKEVTCEVLSRTDYPEWDDLIDRSPHGTVFHYSWWLESTSDDFTILAIRNERGAIIAGIPIPRERRSGLRLLHSPCLTPYLGPV